MEVAREYGRLRQRLRTKGRPLPENDIWIAATAKHHELVLVTRDRHFGDVDDLLVEAW
jgi:tRNA(fMet)-specific endonuclease VapC